VNEFLTWSDSKVKADNALEKLKEQAKQLKANDSQFSLPRRVNLNLWPYLLVMASSLKFSKAMAKLKKG
jgi:hypothetical protein